MKNVRIFYTKCGRMKFISHLDMTRFMTRMLRKAGLPIWYTEGFHPHAYITFALPLSLGFESQYEIMDIRLEDDNFPIDSVCEKLNAVFPEYVRAFDAAEPEQKVGKIGFAEFKISFSDNGELREELGDFLKREQILCKKKTKSGALKEIDLAVKMQNISLGGEVNTELTVLLPAGGQENINPELICNSFFDTASEYYPYSVVRTKVLNLEKEIFR